MHIHVFTELRYRYLLFFCILLLRLFRFLTQFTRSFLKKNNDDKIVKNNNKRKKQSTSNSAQQRYDDRIYAIYTLKTYGTNMKHATDKVHFTFSALSRFCFSFFFLSLCRAKMPFANQCI